MKGFLETDYSAYLFIEDSQIIGYALTRNTSNPVYLRQFLIDRNYRKQINDYMGYSDFSSVAQAVFTILQSAILILN